MRAQEESARRTRKTVTVVFSDVTGSTAVGEQVDPEPFQALLARYYDAMREAVERHGGTVEKFIGDAVMAVFGVPQVHEDDALRAVRAAADMREALAALNAELRRDELGTLAVRFGVNTGEVVAGDPGIGQSFATGDAVNLAARLEQHAHPGEILLGESTYRLVSAAVEAEPVEPLSVKGKADPVRAWRLLRPAPGDEGGRHPETPFVGRERELETLAQALDDAIARACCRLVTIIGEAGVGKSRLVRELAARSSERARCVVGRCLPYGEGITYRPLGEIVGDLAGGDAAVLRSLVGDGLASSEEIQWTARRLFEALARDRPLVVVLEDVHWAEPTFLDLVEYVAGFSRDAPILLLCVARPDLLESRPSWSAPRSNAGIVPLEPLTDEQAATLVDRIAPELSQEERRRILDAAEGNPLFVEHLLAYAGERGLGAIGVPPSLSALLAARIDALDAAQRAAIECAAVEGRAFHRGAVAALVADDARAGVTSALLGLVRQGLVVPARSQLPGDDGFRFAHIMIRDAAYEGILKRRRADMHARFASWLQQRANGAPQEVEEVLAYHLESAYRYRAELGLRDERARELGARAARHLARAGERALARGDVAAAANLLERGAAVAERDAPGTPALLASLGMARTAAGELDRALEALTEASELARAAGDEGTQARAAVERARIGLITGRLPPDETRAEAQRAIATLEPLGDDLGLAKAWLLLVFVHNWLLQYSAQERAAERARTHALRAGASRDAADALLWLAPAVVLGSSPVPDSLERFTQVVETAPEPLTEAAALLTLGCLRLMIGETEAGRALYRRSEAIYRDLGMHLFAAAQASLTGSVELSAGDAGTAERLLRAGLAELEEMGERGLLSTTAAVLARVLCVSGRYDEAERLAARAEELSGPEDAGNAIVVAGVRARVAAARGDLDVAVRAAEAAVARAEAVDCLEVQADSYAALADVRAAAGEGAAGPLALALALYEQKRNDVAAERVRRALARLAP